MYYDTCTDVHIHTKTHTQKNKYIYNNSRINCGNDKKNQWFYHNQFGSYNYYRNYLKPTIIQSKLYYKVTYKCFIDAVCRVIIIYLTIIDEDIC